MTGQDIFTFFIDSMIILVRQNTTTILQTVNQWNFVNLSIYQKHHNIEKSYDAVGKKPLQKTMSSWETTTFICKIGLCQFGNFYDESLGGNI